MAVKTKMQLNFFKVGFLSEMIPPYQYPKDINVRITPIIEVHTTEDDPK